MNKPEAIRRKLNSDGFTLLEVLIAIVVLAIVSIPLLRSFSSAANTNAKSKLQARANMAAETIMEDSKYMSLEALFEKYLGNNSDTDGDGVADTFEFLDIYESSPGEYSFMVDENSAIKAWDLGLPKGYYALVSFDANKYPGANGFNYADVPAISSNTSAIYMMNSGLDKEAAEEYASYSKSYKGADAKEAEFFEKNIKRTMQVGINKLGSINDGDGNKIDEVEVTISVFYELKPAASAYVPPSNKKLQKINRQTVFINSNTKVPIESLYIMYYPLYGGETKSDIIAVDNSGNVPVNLFVIAQSTIGNKTKWAEYKNKKTLNLFIYEDVDTTVKETYTKLRTNVFDGDIKENKNAPVGVPIKLGFNLNYGRGVFTIKKDDAAGKLLEAADLDGRLFNAQELGNTIYYMRIDVYNSANESIADIRGTKLE